MDTHQRYRTGRIYLFRIRCKNIGRIEAGIDFSVPAFDKCKIAPVQHIKRRCRRIATLETRWLFNKKI